jgi:hypothetical protein
MTESANPTTHDTDAEERAAAQLDRLIANQQRSAALVEGLGTDRDDSTPIRCFAHRVHDSFPAYFDESAAR